MLSKTTFRNGMATLCEIYEREPTDLLLKAYYATLKILSDEEFTKAVGAVMSNNVFNKLPRPAEIMEMVNGKPEDAAQIALRKLEEGLQKYGCYDSVAFDDPLIHAVVQGMGGWIAVSEASATEEWKWLRKDFEKLYLALVRNRPAALRTPPTLAGFHEIGNNARGFESHVEVKFIGDEKKAKKLLSQTRSAENKQAPKLVEMRGI
jgi:Domain of unknown function (DUF6475)